MKRELDVKLLYFVVNVTNALEGIKEDDFSFLFHFRKRFITTTITGAITGNLTPLGDKLVLMNRKQSYLHTGTHPSPRSVSV